MNRSPRAKGSRGITLIPLLVILVAAGILSNITVTHLYRTYQRTRQATRQEKAFHLARGGVNLAISHLRQDPATRTTLTRKDGDETLTVRIEEGIIRCVVGRVGNPVGYPDVCLTVNWSVDPAGGVRLKNWKEE